MSYRWPLLGAACFLLAGPPAFADNAAKELAGAARKAGKITSDAFQLKEGSAARPVRGKYQKGQPLYLEADTIPFYLKGDVLVYEDAGKWQRSRTGRLSDPLRILGASAKVRRVTLPHEELAGLAKDLKDIKKAAAEKGATLYTGELKDEAVKKWAPSEDRGVTRGGTVRVWVRGGIVIKYEVRLRLKGRRGDAQVDGSAERAVEMSAVGATKVNPPAAARKALE
jgi:hypothetical protein